MLWLTIAGGVFLVWLVLVFLFTPGIDYHLSRRTSVHDKDFLYTLQSTCQAALHHGNRITCFTDGPAFYPAMLEAIQQAKRSINMECYIFEYGKIGRAFIDALSERARNGVEVTVVVDAIGSFSLWGRPVARLRAAGVRIKSYQALRWYSLHRINNRTHRELLIVDGTVAFAGGAGIADWWMEPAARRKRPWRETMARIEGPIVAALQGRRGGKLARVLRRNPDRARLLSGFETLRRHDRIRRQELAVGSRHGVTRQLPDADRRRGPHGSHPDAVLPAGPRLPAGVGRDGQPRRPAHRDRAGTAH
jgi:hypothetical protein